MQRRILPLVLATLIAGTGTSAIAGSNPVGPHSQIAFSARAATTSQSAGRASHRQVVEAQQMLQQLGYRPGGADGVAGAKTRRAVMQFQRKHDLATNGRVTSRLIARLEDAVADESGGWFSRTTAKVKSFFGGDDEPASRKASAPARKTRSAKAESDQGWAAQAKSDVADFFEQNSREHAALAARCEATRDQYIRDTEGAWIDCTDYN